MTDSNTTDPSKTYFQMKPNGKSHAWSAKDFWEATKTGKGLESPFGYLVARYNFSRTWDHWECHANGDELLIAIEGSMQLLLEIDGKEKSVTLAAPNSFLVPAGSSFFLN